MHVLNDTAHANQGVKEKIISCAFDTAGAQDNGAADTTCGDDNLRRKNLGTFPFPGELDASGCSVFDNYPFNFSPVRDLAPLQKLPVSGSLSPHSRISTFFFRFDNSLATVAPPGPMPTMI